MLYGLECTVCKMEREERELQRNREYEGVGTLIMLVAVIYVAAKAALEMV